MAARRRLTVKRLDPWSVLKFGFLANLCLLAIGLLGSLVAWFFVNRLELITKACDVAESVGFESCGVDGGNLFRLVLLLGLLGVVIQTGLLVFLSFLHNLIADLVGGLQISVVDEAVGASRRATEQVQAARTRPAPIGADRTQARPARHPQLPATEEEETTAPPAPPPRSPASSAPVGAGSRDAGGGGTAGGSGGAQAARPQAGERQRGPATESVFGDRGGGQQESADDRPSEGRETGPIRRAETADDDSSSEGGDEPPQERESTWSRRADRSDSS